MSTILIIDDDPVQRFFVRVVLGEAGWRIAEASGGRAGLAALAGIGPALVLLDLQMPGMDGFATARAIRAQAGGALVPIVAFSALHGGAADEAMRAAGIDGHVAKPCTPAELADAVRPWLADEGAAARGRMEAVFGEAKWLELLAAMREQLADALRQADDGGLAGRAHRIAGLGGTLGFPAISETWGALAEGDRRGTGPARASARAAILAIDRRLRGAAAR